MGLDNPVHLLLLLLIVLLVFGAKRRPEIGRSLGSGMRGFKDRLSGETPVRCRRRRRSHRCSPRHSPSSASLARRVPAVPRLARPTAHVAPSGPIVPERAPARIREIPQTYWGARHGSAALRSHHAPRGDDPPVAASRGTTPTGRGVASRGDAGVNARRAAQAPSRCRAAAPRGGADAQARGPRPGRRRRPGSRCSRWAWTPSAMSWCA